MWMSCILFVAQYIMPQFGIVDRQYAVFTFLGNLAVWGLFETMTSVALFLGDLQGDKTIQYYISLPLPTWLVFFEQAVASAYRSLASTILLLPLGALILGDAFPFSTANWSYFIIAYLIVNLFYGCFSLFIASQVPDLSSLTTIRTRIIFPLWFLGGYQFPWKMLYKINPVLAYINFCNPIVFIMDGLRCTILPQQDYLPFWICMIALICFSLLTSYLGIKKLKKQLDCI
jgi:ABC-type polysaccharide/polyol phosphate export permease